MLRISKIVDYGTLVLTHMAAQPSSVYSANDLAGALGLGQPIVSKVLKLLNQNGLVISLRGAHGGYRLSRAPEHINIAQVIDALEDQPFGLTECTAMPGQCSVEADCHIRTHWQRINNIVRQSLEAVSIAEMVRVDGGTFPPPRPPALPGARVKAPNSQTWSFSK